MGVSHLVHTAAKCRTVRAHEELGVVVHICNPTTVEADREIPGSYCQAGQPVSLTV